MTVAASHPLPEYRVPAWRRAMRYTLYTVLTLIVLLMLALGTTVALLQSEKGRAWVVAQVNKTGVIALRSLEGDFVREVILHDVVYQDDSLRATLDEVRWRWDWSVWRQRQLSISILEAGTLNITSQSARSMVVEKTPSSPPASLTLPFAITVDTLRLKAFSWDGFRIDNIELSIRSTGSWHLVNLTHLKMQQGVIDGALGVDGTAPFNVGGRVSYRGVFEERQVGFDFDIDGSLRDFHLIGQVFGEHMNIQSAGRFDLFAPYVYSMFHEATLQVDDLDPSRVFPGLPKGNVNIKLDLKPLPGKLVQGTLHMENAAPGTVEQNRIPVKALSSQFEVQDDQIVFYGLEVAALDNARLEGQGWLREDQLRARLVLADVNAAALWGDQPQSKLSGEVWLEGPYQAPTMKLDLHDALYQVAARLDLAWIDPQHQRRLAVKKAQVDYRGGTAQLTGEYDLSAQVITTQGTFSNVNPAALGAPPGRINGDLRIEGDLTSKVDFRVHYALQSSQWLGQPLTGEGDVRWTADHVSQTSAWLQIGQNRLSAEGTLGAMEDVLRLEMQMPDLAQWGEGLGGRLTGSGELRGPFSQLTLRAQWQARSLQAGSVRAQQAQLNVEAQLTEILPFTLRAEIEAIDAGMATFETLTLRSEGALTQHQVTLNAHGRYQKEPVEAVLALRGAVQQGTKKMQWQGALSHFEVKSLVPLQLTTSLPMVVDATEMRAGPATFVINGSSVRLKTVEWQFQREQLQRAQAQRWHTEGVIEKIDVASWLKLADMASTLRGDLTLSGGWNFSQTGDTLSGLQGALDLTRQQGDVQVRATSRSAWQLLHLSQLGAKAEVNNAKLVVQGVAESSRYGKIGVDGGAVLASWNGVAIEEQPFDLRVQGELPDLSKVAPLIASDVKMTGRLHLEAQHSGSLKASTNRGTLVGENLLVHDIVTGIALTDGDVRLVLNDQNIAVERFVFKGGRGEMTLHGGIDLRQAAPRVRLAIHTDKMRLIRRPDMTLVVTGDGDLGYDEKGVSLTGNLKTDYGNIQYRDSDAPSLSDDVVVMGTAPQAANVGLANVQFDVDLGDKFRFRGYGIDTRLGGVLKLRARPGQALTAYGNVRTEEGTYRAYGQKLEIRRGVISFLGPLDNPTLDILAIRENSSVDAGVAVKGTAMRPNATLYSNPGMPTNETLSWLLFDHGTENMDKGDSAILFHLLNSMLATGDSGGGLTDELFGGVIDEVGVSAGTTDDGTTTQIVTVSKRLTKNLSVGLDKSFNGLQDAIWLTLRLSQQWSVITRFGVDDSAADVRYTITY